MQKFSINQLLKLSNNFYKISHKDYDAEFDKFEKDYQLTNDMLNFKPLFEKLINKKITDDNLLEWLNKNEEMLDYIKFIFNFIQNKDNPEILRAKISGGATSSKIMFIGKVPDLLPVLKNQVFKPIQEMILESTSIIPVLYVEIADYKFILDSPITGEVNKELAHNDFLITVFYNLFGIKEADIISKFYEDNKSKINSLTKSFDGQPKFIGQGMDGIAFSIGKTLVIKFFTNKYVYSKSIESMNRLHDQPELAKTEAMIYDVGSLGEFDNQNLYYYIVEKMKTIDKLTDASQYKLRELDLQIKTEMSKLNLKSLFEKIKDEKKVANKIKQITNFIESKVKEHFNQKYFDSLIAGANLKSTWLNTYIEELIMKFITTRWDVHFGNLGISNDELRYFDPTYTDKTDDSKFIDYELMNQVTA